MSEKMVQIDLGCGATKRLWPGATEYIGIDSTETDNTNLICRLGFKNIPMEDNCVDVATAYDFLEHIPFRLYFPKISHDHEQPLDWGLVMPMRDLFNEIWRVLKHGGIFYSSTPVYPNRECWQDPTHVSVWTEETPNYFSDDYYSFHNHYGHTSRFEKVSQKIVGTHMLLTLRAIKNLLDDAEYKIVYPNSV